ncbi:restriction endonuclease subunit S [Saccharospirillum sp.]|uniref:restriction endonuclease subunit S n=1 Tax=Saccharospirillum sp. TaxID=2033801 RepID=UPI0034A00C2C
MVDALIPQQWVSVPLNEVIQRIVGGGTPSKAKPEYYRGEIPWMSVKDMNKHVLLDTVDHISQEAVDNSSTNVIPAGTPIIATRMSLGKIVVANFDSAINQDLKALFLPSNLNRNYLIYWYRSIARTIEQMGTGTTVKGIRLEALKELDFSLPPLAEQKGIADKLDILLAQVENTKARLERIPQILKRFRQSVLAAAVSGRLTEEWREQTCPPQVDLQKITDLLFNDGITTGNFGKKLDRAPKYSDGELELAIKHIEGWPFVRVGEICACIVPNRDKPKSFSGGYHWLLTPNFNEQSIYINYRDVELGLSEKEVKDYKAKVIPEGNVVMTCVGRLGLSAVIEEPSVINQQLHAFIVNKNILSEYLSFCIRANRRFYESRSTSTTVNYLNKLACNSLPIPLPTISEQTEIVRQVDQLFAYADRIEQQVNNALARVNNLTQSILAKAFRGELTEQWRKDNPDLISGENSAEALLERIKAERAEAKPAKRSRKVSA